MLVLGSILLHIVGANLAWRVRVVPESNLAERARKLSASNFVRVLFGILRFVYYVGMPYVAVIFGWVDVRTLGLGYLDWADGLRWIIVIALASWSLLMFVWVPYLRATSDVPLQFDSQSFSWARRVVEVIYMQAHWAFYRAASILALANFLNDDLAVYWGTSAGIALICIEAWADPRVRCQLARVGKGESALWSAGQAIINMAGFVLTRNVWLLALLHLALEFTVPHLRMMPAPARVPLNQNVTSTQ